MVAVFVKVSENYEGLMPRVLRDIYRGRNHRLPKVGEKAELLDSKTGDFMCTGKVERVNEDARTYDVRVW